VLFLYSYTRRIPVVYVWPASATCVPHNPACDEGLACPQANPPRIAASIVMLRLSPRHSIQDKVLMFESTKAGENVG
jgi:hypothetical protein